MLPESYDIAATAETPAVILDASAGVYRIEGRSLPENAHKFYQPFIDWFVRLLETPGRQLELELYLDYYNSSTGRYLMELMLALEEYSNTSNVGILWKADADDDIMLEKGEEFRQLLKIPVQVKALES